MSEHLSVVHVFLWSPFSFAHTFTMVQIHEYSQWTIRKPTDFTIAQPVCFISERVRASKRAPYLAPGGEGSVEGRTTALNLSSSSPFSRSVRFLNTGLFSISWAILHALASWSLYSSVFLGSSFTLQKEQRPLRQHHHCDDAERNG